MKTRVRKVLQERMRDPIPHAPIRKRIGKTDDLVARLLKSLWNEPHIDALHGHGRRSTGSRYFERAQRFPETFRRLNVQERAAIFGILMDEWCSQCGEEHPHCKCPPRTYVQIVDTSLKSNGTYI